MKPANRVIKLELSARRRKVLLLNDLIPALILLFTGLESLTEGTSSVLMLANVILGGLMVIYFLREWRSLKAPSHGMIRWYDLISALVMMIDAGNMYKPLKGFQPAHLYFAASLLIILRGFSIIKPVPPFRRLIISDTGFTIKLSPFHTFRFAWEDVLDIEITDQVLRVITLKGKQEISLRKIAHTGEIRTELLSMLRAKRSLLESNSSTLPA